VGSPPTILLQLVKNSVRLRDRTKDIYVDAIERYLAFVGTTDPERWTGQSVVDWRTELVARGTLKNQSVNLLLKGLRYSSRRWAETERDPSRDFARVAELLKPGPKEKRVSLTIEQAKSLVAACNGNKPHDHRDRSAILLMLRSGIRRSGLCGAMIERLRGTQLSFELKGGELHTVDLDAEETLPALRYWISWLRSCGVTSGPIFRALKPSLSSNAIEIGASLSPQRLYEIVRDRAEEAGVGHCFPHRLRHSFVSIGLDAGIEPWRLRLVTGHKREIQVEEYATDLRAQRREPVSALLPSFGSR